VVFSSPHSDVAIPEIPLPSFVLQRAAELGDRPALIDGPSGRTLSYEEVARSVDAVAANLERRGLETGDVFAIFCPNVPEFALAWHGAAAAGAACTTANPLLTVDELAWQLGDAGARYLLTIPELLDGALPAAAKARVEEVFVVGEADGATPFGLLTENGGDAAGRARPDRKPMNVAIEPRSTTVALPYSSGTTGLPKGVKLSHRNLVANICQVEAVHDLGPGDVVIGVLPFWHIYGMTVTMNLALHGGATTVTMPRFDLEQFLGLLQDHGVTKAHLVPPIILALAKHPAVDAYDLSRLRYIMSGAAPLGPDLAAACAERLGCFVVQGYGLTEASPVTHLTPDAGPNKPGSIGPPIPNTECRIVDPETEAELGANETGEVWVRGPQVMGGYLDNPEATAASIRDGWLRTGDLAYADDDGYVFVVDRLKELIKYKGFPVAPAELEALLISHPAVADAAVVPSPDEAAGEVPKAYVVTSAPVGPDELMDYVAARVAPQKRIRRVEMIDAIPKSPSGKILRRVLVARERGG
jgi:acyl-CoA synthetase (AMP-forming)/AMP-acid ligase II